MLTQILLVASPSSPRGHGPSSVSKTRRFPYPPHGRIGFVGIIDIVVMYILLLSKLNERSSRIFMSPDK